MASEIAKRKIQTLRKFLNWKIDLLRTFNEVKPDLEFSFRVNSGSVYSAPLARYFGIFFIDSCAHGYQSEALYYRWTQHDRK